MLALSSRSGALATRIGPRLQMSVGPMVVGVGLAMLTMVGEDASYVVHVLPAVVVFGLGLAITVAPLTATVLAAAPANVAGMASAINNAVARAAGLIAVAVLPAAAGIGGSVYLDAPAFSAGFHRAVLICALLCLLGGVLSALTIRNPSARPAAVREGPVNCPLDAPPLRGESVRRATTE
jgi:MFS family permease